jgi:hypothetical protein
LYSIGGREEWKATTFRHFLKNDGHRGYGGRRELRLLHLRGLCDLGGKQMQPEEIKKSLILFRLIMRGYLTSILYILPSSCVNLVKSRGFSTSAKHMPPRTPIKTFIHTRRRR